MKKTRKWPSLLITAFTVLSFSACQEWGEMDPPAGNQVYPKLEQVSDITFEDDAFDPTSFNYYAYEGGDIAAVEDSESETYGKVLHLLNGYARFFNPLNNVKVQNGVSITFMMKQALQVDEETGETLENDLTGALFSFQNANSTQRMFFTANGWLKYEAVDGNYETNNPTTEFKTEMVKNDGEWHYIALKVRNDGYEVYVDGKKKVEKTETGFDFSKVVKFMASVPYIYVGYGADDNTREMWIDNIKIYRNQITANEIKDPRKPETGEVDYRTYINVGPEDNVTTWWTYFSDTFTFKNSLHLGFYNYGSGAANWNNWVLVITDGTGPSKGTEYIVIRADNFGWGTYWDAATKTCDYNWDTFIADMQGAYIDMTIERSAGHVNVTVKATTTSGTVYNYTISFDGDFADTMGAFLTCDGSHFKLDAEDVYTDGAAFNPGSYLVGPADCSAGWWTAFSNNYIIEGNTASPFGFVFTNNNSGSGANWNNWLIVATNGIERGGSGYAEYFVLRSDAFGWGDANYNAANISANFDWTTFVTDMKGAHVRLFLSRLNEQLSLKAKVRTADGVTLDDYTFHHDAISTENTGAFLTAELASLDILKVGYFPYANLIEK